MLRTSIALIICLVTNSAFLRAQTIGSDYIKNVGDFYKKQGQTAEQYFDEYQRIKTNRTVVLKGGIYPEHRLAVLNDIARLCEDNKATKEDLDAIAYAVKNDSNEFVKATALMYYGFCNSNTKSDAFLSSIVKVGFGLDAVDNVFADLADFFGLLGGFGKEKYFILINGAIKGLVASRTPGSRALLENLNDYYIKNKGLFSRANYNKNAIINRVQVNILEGIASKGGVEYLAKRMSEPKPVPTNPMYDATTRIYSAVFLSRLGYAQDEVKKELGRIAGSSEWGDATVNEAAAMCLGKLDNRPVAVIGMPGTLNKSMVKENYYKKYKIDFLKEKEKLEKGTASLMKFVAIWFALDVAYVLIEPILTSEILPLIYGSSKLKTTPKTFGPSATKDLANAAKNDLGGVIDVRVAGDELGSGGGFFKPGPKDNPFGSSGGTDVLVKSPTTKIKLYDVPVNTDVLNASKGVKITPTSSIKDINQINPSMKNTLYEQVPEWVHPNKLLEQEVATEIPKIPGAVIGSGLTSAFTSNLSSDDQNLNPLTRIIGSEVYVQISPGTYVNKEDLKNPNPTKYRFEDSKMVGLSNSQTVPITLDDYINITINKSWQTFVEEGQKAWNVKTSQELAENFKPIDKSLKGSSGGDAVREGFLNGEVYIIKSMKGSDPYREIRNAEILYKIGLGEKPYLLPKKDPQTSEADWDLLMKKSPGINLKYLYQNPFGKTEYLMKNIPELLQKDFANIEDAVSEYAKAVLSEEDVLKVMTKLLNKYFVATNDFQVVVRPAVNDTPFSWCVIDAGGFVVKNDRMNCPYKHLCTPDDSKNLLIRRLELVADRKFKELK